jgi:acyl carrier protein
MRGTRTIGIAIVAVAAPLMGGCASATEAQDEDQQADTARKVKEAVVEILRIAPGKIVPGARFVEDLGADSLDCVEIVMALEEKFGIAIADADVSTLKTVGDVTVYIDKRRRPRR